MHLEPNLGMMGVQKKKKMCTVSFAASVALLRPGLQITCGSSPKPIGFCIRTQHTLMREHQLSNGQAIDTRDGKKMFLTWENVGVGLFCMKDITVPRRQVLFFCGAGGEKKKEEWILDGEELETQQEEPQPI